MYENARMQQKIYEQEMNIAKVQKDLEKKMHQEKRLQEIMQMCDLKEDKVINEVHNIGLFTSTENCLLSRRWTKGRKENIW